jgi:hypothetical protein
LPAGFHFGSGRDGIRGNIKIYSSLVAGEINDEGVGSEHDSD